MIGKLYIISHPDFLPNGHLRPVVRSTFASTIMYFPKTENDLGAQHLFNLSLKNPAREIGLIDVLASDPVGVLHVWSEKITADFKDRNNSTCCDSEDDVLPALKEMCSMMRTMKDKVDKLVTFSKDQNQTIRNLQAQVETLANSNRQMEIDIEKMKRKVDQLRTPTQTPRKQDNYSPLTPIDVKQQRLGDEFDLLTECSPPTTSIAAPIVTQPSQTQSIVTQPVQTSLPNPRRVATNSTNGMVTC